MLAVIAHLLIIWMLLRLGPSVLTPKPPAKPPTTFSMLPDAEQEAPKAASQPRAAAAHKAAAAAPSSRTPPPPPPPVPPKTPTKPAAEQPATPAPPTLFGDKSLFGAGDIAALPHGEAGEGHDTGKDSASVYGPGEGSGGERLYSEQWHREPTAAELASYIPPNLPPGSWAAVACKTVANYRVENCRSIGEEPLGSGFGRAVRLASWQFLVDPPRKNGKPMIGAWVKIVIYMRDLK